MAKQVQVIRQTKYLDEEDAIRVAAYCRVSTDHKDQINSFLAQMQYYNEYTPNILPLRNRPNRGEEDRYYYENANPAITEEGYRGKKCRRCEDAIKTEILKAVGHKFTDSYFIATCEEEGYTLHTCLSCGNEYKDNIVAATGHDYETEVVRIPHCETEGERKFHCRKCEKEYYSDIPATGHNYELTGTEEVNGRNVRSYVCTNCGAVTTQDMGDQYGQVSSYVEYLFEQYRPYMWWVLLACAGVWSIVMGVFFAIAQKNEDKEKARKMLKNYVVGLVVIAVILVACPYLVKGIAALIAG